MKKTIILFLIILTGLLAGRFLFAAEEPLVLGGMEGTGNYFELSDSEYLNVVLESSEEVKVILESVPGMINLDIESATGAVESTELTLENLIPNKTYYKYQDSYKNGVIFNSDENGSYSWMQDITTIHHVWIQEEKSTIFLPEDCSNYGFWDAPSSTCTLTQDLTESVEITENNFILDCNNHSILSSTHTGYGIYSRGKNNNIIKNCSVGNFLYGFYIESSAYTTTTNNTIFNNSYGIYIRWGYYNSFVNNIIYNSSEGVYLFSTSRNLINSNKITNNSRGILLYTYPEFNLITENIISENVWGIYLYYAARNNIIIENDISNNRTGFFICCYGSSNNKIYHNNFLNNIYQTEINIATGNTNFFDNGYPSAGNYWSNYTGIDEKSGPNQDQTGSDKIIDAPYIFPRGQDKYPYLRENGWSTSIEPEKWSFAVITDLHIGRGYSDYDGAGYGSDGEGEEYYLTERLKKVVNWINENKNNVDCDGTKCPIKFVAILGDISDSGEKSEYLKVKSILDALNDPNNNGNTAEGIPYVPIFGNHDILPRTDFEQSTTGLGESYFEEILWGENATNTKLLEERLDFRRDEENRSYKNFTLKYGDINFIGLDFVSREATADGSKSEAVISPETESWIRDNLNQYQGKERVIFLSHYLFTEEFSRSLYVTRFNNFDPLEINELKNLIEEYENITEGTQVLGEFGGHIHGFEKFMKEITFDISPIDLFMNANWEYPSLGVVSAVSTEALMVSGNEQDISNKGVIRIIRVNGDQEINSSTTEGKFPALNPYISFDFTQATNILPCVFFKAHLFTQRNFSLTWDFNDGESDSNVWQTHCYSEAGIYNVKLTAVDEETGETEYITREVEVKQGIVPKIIKIAEGVKDTLELISMELDEKVTKFGRTMKDTILVKVKHSPSTPVGAFTVHFEQATSDIDLTQLVADFDLNKRKSVLYSPFWPLVIDGEKVLFVPSSGIGSAYFCPQAPSLYDVTPFCPGVTVFNIGDSKNGLSLTAIEYEGQEYCILYGIEEGGAGELGPIESNIINLDNYVKNLPYSAFKNNPSQRKNTLINKVKEVYLKIENQEYQEAINKLQNDIYAKLDGDRTAQDWVIDFESQKGIIIFVNDLVVHIKRLL